VLHINEVYPSIQGEGVFAGEPTIFVRTQGCSLRCVWCDTPYGLPFGEKATEIGEGEFHTPLQVLDRVILASEGKAYHHVCLTGGDPLQQNNVSLLAFLKLAVQAGFTITIETGGHIPTVKYIELAKEFGRIYLCVDYKLPCSGMNEKMKSSAFSTLREEDSIKFVVGSKDDFDEAMLFLDHQRENKVKALALFSPVWDSELSVRELANLVMKLPKFFAPARLSLQLHKLIWEPATRAV
jgi:7-carboxy-7-deazaguanine synthase